MEAGDITLFPLIICPSFLLFRPITRFLTGSPFLTFLQRRKCSFPKKKSRGRETEGTSFPLKSYGAERERMESLSPFLSPFFWGGTEEIVRRRRVLKVPFYFHYISLSSLTSTLSSSSSSEMEKLKFWTLPFSWLLSFLKYSCFEFYVLRIYLEIFA